MSPGDVMSYSEVKQWIVHVHWQVLVKHAHCHSKASFIKGCVRKTFIVRSRRCTLYANDAKTFDCAKRNGPWNVARRYVCNRCSQTIWMSSHHHHTTCPTSPADRGRCWSSTFRSTKSDNSCTRSVHPGHSSKEPYSSSIKNSSLSSGTKRASIRRYH